jgi:hypothetical protein
VLSRHSWWRNKTILSRQREWRDKLFHVRNAVKCAVSCYANACGATSTTKEITLWKIFSGAVNIKMFIKKGLKFKQNPYICGVTV